MDNEAIAEKLSLVPRIDPRWLWAERLIIVVSGITFVKLVTSPLRGDSDSLRSMAILWFPYFVTILLLRKNPPYKHSHEAVLGLSAMGMVLTFPGMAIQVAIKGMALWSNPNNLLAMLAGLTQASLILLAGRMHLLQDGRMRDILGVVLLGLVLGLFLFVLVQT